MSYLKFEIDCLSDKISFRKTEKKIIKRHALLLFWHISVFVSVSHRMMLISHTYSSQFMECQNLGITSLKHATTYAPNVFKKLPENQINTDFIYLTSSNFVTISHINYWDQVISWKKFLKFWNGPLCRNKSCPFPLLNVAAYWQSSNSEACAKKLSQVLPNNIDNRGRGIGFRIDVR